MWHSGFEFEETLIGLTTSKSSKPEREDHPEERHTPLPTASPLFWGWREGVYWVIMSPDNPLPSNSAAAKAFGPWDWPLGLASGPDVC
jgi:hypothetical protein